jgi:hypothetical protein
LNYVSNSLIIEIVALLEFVIFLHKNFFGSFPLLSNILCSFPKSEKINPNKPKAAP